MVHRDEIDTLKRENAELRDFASDLWFYGQVEGDEARARALGIMEEADRG
jgi:hypothetical protein